MDPMHFDRLSRAISGSGSRRATLSLALGGVLAGIAAGSAAAKKKKKGKGRKGCPKGKKKCGNKCLANEKCCTYVDCTGCRNEDCINGTCQCGPELIKHNGMCGFFTSCKSSGEACTAHEECCSATCIGSQCDKSKYHCVADIDCLSGPCRGFLCPEALEPYFDLCRP